MPARSRRIPGTRLQDADLAQALYDAESFEIDIEGTTWDDVHRAWLLAQTSLRYADAIYVAAAERHHTALLTADARIARSGAQVECEIITVVPSEDSQPTRHRLPRTGQHPDE